MKIVVLIARILLGLVFAFFGSNLLFNFLHAPPQSGLIGQFSTALAQSHYIYAVGLCQLVPGILLLIGRYVPLALTILGPVIVNILLVHFLMAPAGIPIALFVTLLWFLIFWHVRSAFAGIFQARVEPR